MITRTLLFIFTLMSFACGDAQNAMPSVEDQLTKIESLEKDIFPEGMDKGTDTTRAWPYVRAVQAFAEANKESAKTPELLMKAAGIASGTEWTNKSIQLWGYVWRWFPDHEKAPYALFYQGFVLDSKYNKNTLAIKYYNDFLERYPEHELAEQVKISIEVLKGDKKTPVPTN